MPSSYCPQCNGSGVVRRDGADHSGNVEWTERCPNGCPQPPQAPQSTLVNVIETVIGVLLIGGLILLASFSK